MCLLACMCGCWTLVPPPCIAVSKLQGLVWLLMWGRWIAAGRAAEIGLAAGVRQVNCCWQPTSSPAQKSFEILPPLQLAIALGDLNLQEHHSSELAELWVGPRSTDLSQTMAGLGELHQVCR